MAIIAKNAYKKVKPLADKKKIRITNSIKKVHVKAEPQNMEKLILIFLENAVKYTPKKGKVSLKVYKKRGSAIIRIEDNGIGINDKDRKRIFERFYRADESRTKKSADGFGLGLSIAKKIVEMYKGNISVKSNIGEGSVFVVRLPAQ